jgi:hypothetical protein
MFALRTTHALIVPLLLMLLAASGSAQESITGETASPSEFRFIRLVYANYGGFGGFGGFRGGRGRNSWTTDSPEAETHLLQGIRRLTRVDTSPVGGYMRATDDALFDYPFLYAVEVGHWALSDAEATRLREYLLRGGFLMVDDFWGTEEWQVFIESMHKVFPDRPIVELDDAHPIFHVHFEVDHKVQIPGIRGAITGQHWEKDGYVPHWRAIYDDDGRVMVSINYNMDMGDAWEHADNPQYPEPLTTLAYHFTINYLLYAMTH